MTAELEEAGDSEDGGPRRRVMKAEGASYGRGWAMAAFGRADDAKGTGRREDECLAIQRVWAPIWLRMRARQGNVVRYSLSFPIPNSYDTQTMVLGAGKSNS